jgi:hypothetical protein
MLCALQKRLQHLLALHVSSTLLPAGCTTGAGMADTYRRQNLALPKMLTLHILRQLSILPTKGKL